MPDIDQDQDQGQDQDQEQEQQTQSQLTGGQLSELHGLALQMQAANDPRTQKLWNFIQGQTDPGDGNPKPQFTMSRTPLKVTSWLEDLENDLWGSKQESESDDAAQDAESNDEVNAAGSEAAPAESSAAEPAEVESVSPQQEQQLGVSDQDASGDQSVPLPATPASQSVDSAAQKMPAGGAGPRRVHLISYTVGNPSGDDDFKKAAYTRASDIKNSKSFDEKRDLVLVYGLQSKDNFKWALQDAGNFGNIQELALFSHGGRNDGPIFHDAAGAEENLTKDEAANLNINFTPSAHADFMACHTATNGFADNFANAHKVLALGFAGTTFSGEPYEKTYGYQSGDREYMLGSEGILNRAWRRVIGGEDLRGPQFFYPKEGNSANPGAGLR